MRDLEHGNEGLPVGFRSEQDVLAVTEHLRKIQAGAGIVYEEAIDNWPAFRADVRGLVR